MTKRLPRWLAGFAAASLLALGAVQAHADADSLRQRYTDMSAELHNNAYGRPLHIDSAEGKNTLQGDVYAVLNHPFDKVQQALQDPQAWCDIMMLPFNTTGCQASGNALTVRIARKAEQPSRDVYPISFSLSPGGGGSDYLQTRLNAAQGPFGTHDYRVEVEAVPIEGGKTFMHMRYSYGFGGMGRFAMQAYMATAGASKVGFTTGGVRGAVERNAMRYYLAIDAYLNTMDLPAAQRTDKRINEWFSATERYPRQLHEMDRGTYVSLKRQEYGQQETASR
jgi:hypothetical protein